MRFTVIVPVYNVVECLSRCIESIRRQRCEFECICIDDGSTDASGELLDQYAFKDPRITVIHQANQGVSAARNVGLEKATGDWITFLDADDYLDESYLIGVEQVITKNSNVEIVQTRLTIDGLDGHSWLMPDFSRSNLYVGDVLNESRLQGENIGSISCDKIFSRKLICENNIRFSRMLKNGEDSLFAISALACAKRVFVDASNNGYHYVRRAGSADCSPLTLWKLTQRIELAYELIELYDKHKIDGVHYCVRLSATSLPYLPQCDQSLRGEYIRSLVGDARWNGRIIAFLLFHCTVKSFVFALSYVVLPRRFKVAFIDYLQRNAEIKKDHGKLSK